MSMEKGTVNDGLEQKTDDVTVETATEQKDAAAAASAEQGAVGTPAKKSKKKYIIAAVIAVLLVAVGQPLQTTIHCPILFEAKAVRKVTIAILPRKIVIKQ